MTQPTRIEGPRSALVRFSTGRAATLRAVPSFRAMLREGLIDKHDEANIQDVLEGRIPASLLGDAFEDALLRHLLIDPSLHGPELAVLDDAEAQEIVQFAFRAYLDSMRVAESADDDDEEADEPEVEEAEPAEVAPEPDHEAAARAILETAPTDPTPEEAD